MNRLLSFPLSGPQEIARSVPTTDIDSDENQSGKGLLPWTSDHQSIREVIWTVLLTAPGERLMRPDFGAGLTRYIHHSNNETTRRLIADIAIKAIQRWEKRIDVIELTVTTNATSLNEISLNIFYRIRATGVQENMHLGLQLKG